MKVTTNKNKAPIDRCNGQTVHAVKLSDYLGWAAHPEKYTDGLKLPPIQRGFVWKPKQIQDLWDSLLRGMPIGSVLVQQFSGGESEIPLGGGAQNIEKKTDAGWYLLDGQQRTLSTLLGFPCDIKMKHKLWVDFSDGGDKTKYQFRVTTENQPFGYRPNGQRLSKDDRRKARERWGEAEKLSSSDIFADKSTRPWKASKDEQKYMFLVSELWGWMDECADDDYSEWKEKILNRLLLTQLPEDADQRIKEFFTDLCLLKEQWLALIEVKQISVQRDVTSSLDQEYMTLLFERVSRGGTPLSSEDLLYSMIKQAWPAAHDLVNTLHEKVGVMMTPSDFVMTAYRLAALRTDDISDNPQPKTADFHKYLSRVLGSKKAPGELRIIIEKNGGYLQRAFENLEKCIRYKGDKDIGLPSAFIPYLERPLLQVLLHWCLYASEEDIEKSREDIIRFILFWVVSRPSTGAATKASVEAIRVIGLLSDGNRQVKFPAHLIYEKLTNSENDERDPLFKPLINYGGAKGSKEKVFRTPGERAKLFFGDEGEGLYQQFSGCKHLLLWFQREWVNGAYPDTDFMSGQDEDNVPYDFDHFVPQSNWSSFTGRGKDNDGVIENRQLWIHHWSRCRLGNSIGNYRVMDASDNRSRGDTPLTEIIGDATESFLDNRALWKDYAFSPSDTEYDWRTASPKAKACWLWDDARVLAFQHAVESRVLNLYQRLFEEASMAALMNKP